MKLDTSRADSLPPYVKGSTDQGEGKDSLPEVFYAAWRDYLLEYPVRDLDEELKESNPEFSRKKRVAIYYSRLRRHLQQAMFRWLDEHDGVVDRWPFPELDGWGGLVVQRTNYETGKTSTSEEYPFALFEPSFYGREVRNGFTNCDSPSAPEKPHVCTENVTRYQKHYWDSYNKEKEEYDYQERCLQGYKKDNDTLKKEIRITPLKVLALILLIFLVLNSVVMFFYCFTGLFDYQKLVDWLYTLTQSGQRPIQIAAWPVYVVQYVNFFLFRNFVPLREQSIIAIVIGYAIMVVVLLVWASIVFVAGGLILSPGGREKLDKEEKDVRAREKRLQEMKQKLDAEKARLERAYQNDDAYRECVKKDQQRTKWLKDSYPRRKKNHKEMCEKYRPYREMIEAYYEYLLRYGLIKNPPESDDWLPNPISMNYDY